MKEFPGRLRAVKELNESSIKMHFGERFFEFPNPNKAGLFEGSFWWGESKLTPQSYFKKNLSNINITLHNC